MGIVNDLWWLSGFVLAAPLGIVGVEFLRDGDLLLGGGFLAVAAAMLLLPEYVRRRLTGTTSGTLESVPVVGRRFRKE